MAVQEFITEHHPRLVQYHATTLPTTNLFAGRLFEIGTTLFVYDGTNWVGLPIERTTSLGSGTFSGQRKTHSTRKTDYEWDGSRWLSVSRYPIAMAARPADVTGANQPYPQSQTVWDCPVPEHDANGIYVEKIQGWMYPFSVAQSATNYYTYSAGAFFGGGSTGLTQASGPVNTMGYTTTLRDWEATLVFNQVLNNTYHAIFFSMTPVLNPGTFYASWTVSYRLIG